MSSTEIRALYDQLLKGWNERSAVAMAEPFAEDGELIGFDGSQVSGRAEIVAHLQPIFADHPTPTFVAIVRGVRPLGPEAALLRAGGASPSFRTPRLSFTACGKPRPADAANRTKAP